MLHRDTSGPTKFLLPLESKRPWFWKSGKILWVPTSDHRTYGRKHMAILYPQIWSFLLLKYHFVANNVLSVSMQWRETYRPGTRDAYIVWNGQKTNGNYIYVFSVLRLYIVSWNAPTQKNDFKPLGTPRKIGCRGRSLPSLQDWPLITLTLAVLAVNFPPQKCHPHEQKKARWFHLGFSCLSKNCAYPTGYIIITFLVNLPFWDLPMFRQTHPFWSRSGLKGFQFLLKLLDFPLNLCKLLMLMAPLKPL